MNFFKKSSLALALANLMALSAAMNSSVLAFGIFPIKVYFERGLSSRDVTLENPENSTVRLKVYVSKWAEDGTGKRTFTPTQDITLFPSILELKPKSKRIIRLAAKLPPSQSEQSYRLFVEQIPELVTKKPEATPSDSEPKPTTATAKLNFLYTLDLPVFVNPINLNRKSALLNSKILGDKLSFDLVNQGNAHIFASAIEITTKDAQGKIIAVKKTNPTYILPSIQRKFTLDLPQEQCQKAKTVSIEVKGGEDMGTKTNLSENLSVDRSICLRKK
jgi:fimbrial chaperone protein